MDRRASPRKIIGIWKTTVASSKNAPWSNQWRPPCPMNIYSAYFTGTNFECECARIRQTLTVSVCGVSSKNVNRKSYRFDTFLINIGYTFLLHRFVYNYSQLDAQTFWVFTRYEIWEVANCLVVQEAFFGQTSDGLNADSRSAETSLLFIFVTT